METVKENLNSSSKRRDAKQSVQVDPTDDDTDDELNRVFTTDTTYDLMVQLKNLLMMSVAEGWHIFDEDPQELNDPGKPSSLFRRSRNSLHQPGSRSSSSVHGKQLPTSELLSLCSVLTSVVLEDCRYQIALPRPSCPPNALQAVTLDVAQFLISTHRREAKTVSQITFAMIPAFSSFQPEMHGRLLRFFEGVIRGILDDLIQMQGGDGVLFQKVCHQVNLDVESGAPNLGESGGHAITDIPSVSIHVDEIQEGPPVDATHSHRILSPACATAKLKSTNSPLQPLTLYYLASVVTPLLEAVLESVHFAPSSETRPEVLHHLYRLLHLIVESKVDAYVDILQVIGCHSSKARRAAVSLLTTFWPKAVGHIVVSRPIPVAPYNAIKDVLESSERYSDHSHAHQFIPWRFIPRSNSATFFGLSLYDCRSCTKSIRGYGLLCPFDMCAVHFDCYDYPEGSHVVQYASVSDPNVQRVAMYRFSEILPDRKDTESRSIEKHGHLFRLVNLFTLCLCSICRQPLWGCTTQGLSCVKCMQCVHTACLSTATVPELLVCSTRGINSDHINIDWKDLRFSCLKFHGEVLNFSYEALGKLGYEEVSILYASMWIQLQILTSGIALGSIVVLQNGKNAAHTKGYETYEFELHHALKMCETHLSSDTLRCSDAMDEYMQENRLARSEHLLMFDWSNLVYMTSAIKTPYTPSQLTHSSSDFLNVIQPDSFVSHFPDAALQPLEVMPLWHIRDVLRQEFNIQADAIAHIIISHLNHLGLFDRLGRNRDTSFFEDGDGRDLYCIFPLPFGLDISTNVEVLLSAMEGCFSDLDLFVNEVGLLLLVRRVWPNGLTTELAFRRLTRNILCWILAEDSSLATILRDYLAKQKHLPGVRSSDDPVSWPSTQISRPTPLSSVNNGGDYLAARRALISRYAIPWLLALHDRGPTAYAALIYETVMEIEDDFSKSDILPAQPNINDKAHLASSCDRVLRSIYRLTQASITFSIFDELFVLWLESVSSYRIYEEPILALSRIFTREVEASYRLTFGSDPITAHAENAVNITFDPWRAVIRVASANKDGLSRSLQWLSVLACSGVEIPVTIFMRFSVLATEYSASLADSLLLVKSVMSATWQKCTGRSEFQELFSEHHARLAPQIIQCLERGNEVQESISFIQISLGTCLLLYGCDRIKTKEHKMIKEEDVMRLPSRRKMNIRGSTMVDPVIIDPRIMDALDRYMALNINDVSCLIAKFLGLYLTESPYLEPYEVDNFILRNGRFLALCAWQFYGIQYVEISNIRTIFLLRTLVVDSQPFQALIHDWFLPDDNWERRLLAVTRLFRIILDIISPNFTVEDRQWRSCVNDIFFYFFTAKWADGSKEIRTAADAFSSTLLQGHFDAISLCWNEYLSKAPIAERTKLVSFLIQLHPHFPTWQVLSWDSIIETLAEGDYDQKNGHDEDAPDAQLVLNSKTNPDFEMALLRVSMLLLSLRMISDGIVIDGTLLLKLKVHLVQVIGFGDISVTSSPSGHSFHIQFGGVSQISPLSLPCVHDLLPVLDASHTVDLPHFAMVGANEQDERPMSLLVGSVFVDVTLAIFCTLQDLSVLPVLALKALLETLRVIIYKHDFESRALRHLQQNLRRAILRALDMLSSDISYELCQLALSVVQAFIKRWHVFMGSIVYTSMESVVKLIASQDHHGQDSLATQAKLFIYTTLNKYAQNGLFFNLLKRNLDDEFFVVLKQIANPIATNSTTTNNPGASGSLRESLLRDVLPRAVDNDQTNFQVVLNNMQTYIEIVFHQDYSLDLLLFTGQHLTLLARRISEWPPGAIDPAPLLHISAILIQHNKAHSREMLIYVDTVMRVVLNRLNISASCLSHLLQATANKTDFNGHSTSPNSIVLLMFEILGDGLRMKARVLPSTLKSMLEAIMATEIPGSLSSVPRLLPSLLHLVESGLYFLHNHIWSDVGSENDFMALLDVGRLVLEVARHDPSVMQRFSHYASEKSAHEYTTVRAWNMLALAALMEPSAKWSAMLFAQLHNCSYAHRTVLRVHGHSGAISVETSTADINHAYITIKLWMMLAQKMSVNSQASSLAPSAVWNELWPPFEYLLSALENEARAGLSLTLASLITSSVADLLVFLHALHTPIALHTSTHLATLNRLQRLALGETSAIKVARALRCMSEPPPEMPIDTLVNQAAKDIVAAEKLRILEGRVAQERRGGPERHRRETRVTT